MDLFNSSGPTLRQGVCLAFGQILDNGSEELLISQASSIMSCIRSGLVDESAIVRAAAATTFDKAQAQLGNMIVDGIIPTLLEALQNAGPQAESALTALREVMSIRSDSVFPILVPTLLTQPMTAFNTRALSSLAAFAGSSMTPHIERMMKALSESMQVEKDDVMQEELRKACLSIMINLPQEAVHRTMMLLLEWAKSKDGFQRSSASLLMQFLCDNPSVSIRDYREAWISQLLALLDDQEQYVVDTAVRMSVAFFATIPKDEYPMYAQSLQWAVEQAGADERPITGLKSAEALKPLIVVVVQGLVAGKDEQRGAAAKAIGVIVKRTLPECAKPFMTQCVGALIRVAGERVTSEVKSDILETMITVLQRAHASVRPFFPQLQRIFLRSLRDVNSQKIRTYAVAALSQLVLYQVYKPMTCSDNLY